MTQAILLSYYLIVIRGITESFEAYEELASLKRFHGTTTAMEVFFLIVCETMQEFELPWTKLTG
jgi:hypothetical protein